MKQILFTSILFLVSSLVKAQNLVGTWYLQQSHFNSKLKAIELFVLQKDSLSIQYETGGPKFLVTYVFSKDSTYSSSSVQLFNKNDPHSISYLLGSTFGKLNWKLLSPTELIMDFYFGEHQKSLRYKLAFTGNSCRLTLIP